jgi:hypothetical protein
MTDISTIAHPAAGTYRRDELFIDGEFVAPVGRHRIDVIDATTEVRSVRSLPERRATSTARLTPHGAHLSASPRATRRNARRSSSASPRASRPARRNWRA